MSRAPDNSAQRASPLFDVDAEPDLSIFKPKAAKKSDIDRETIREVSEKSGFPDREPAKARAAAKPKKQRRRVTGRNVQINIKAKQETIDHLIQIADRRGWVLGEVLEHALDALEGKAKDRT